MMLRLEKDAKIMKTDQLNASAVQGFWKRMMEVVQVRVGISGTLFCENLHYARLRLQDS